MEDRYIRNRIYLTEDEQKLIKKYPILIAGSGIGSVIAECALRFGFENLTIIDGDKVETSNLNRQNYIQDDISKEKVYAIKKRLLDINKKANINVKNCFLTTENLSDHIIGHKIAINALDFSQNIPLIFDEICQKNKIPILHPYNLGWAGLVSVITPDGLTLDALLKPNETFNEVKMVEYVSSYMNFWMDDSQFWINEVLDDYKNEQENLPPPQLSIGSWTLAAMCTHLLYRIATQKKIKKFPEFYLSTIM